MTCEVNQGRGFWNSFGFYTAVAPCADVAQYCIVNPDGSLERICSQHALEKAKLGFKIFLYEERTVASAKYELTRMDERFLRSLRIEP